MNSKIYVLTLTDKELGILASIIGYVEAGEVDGGPLDGETHQQRSANWRVFRSLRSKIRECF